MLSLNALQEAHLTSVQCIKRIQMAQKRADRQENKKMMRKEYKEETGRDGSMETHTVVIFTPVYNTCQH